jgi:hypothetical protein
MSTGWVAAAAAVVGAAIQSDSSRKAINAQNDAASQARADQQSQQDQQREDFKPWREAGVNALTQLTGEMGKPVTSEEVMSDPGYQFGLDEGQKAIDRKIAAMGGRVSGAAIKAAGRFGVNTATAGYGAAYQRRQDRLNRLAAIAGLGQTSTAQTSQLGQINANQQANNALQLGDARGANQIATGNIWANTGNQLAAMYSRKPSGGGNVYTPGGGGTPNNYVSGGANYDAYDFQG